MEQDNKKMKKTFRPFKIIGITLSISIPLLIVIYAFSYLFPIPLEKIGEPPAKIVKHIENVYWDGSHLWITGFFDGTKIAYKEEFKGELINVRQDKYSYYTAIFYKESDKYFIKSIIPSTFEVLEPILKIKSNFFVDGNEFINFELNEIEDKKTGQFVNTIIYYIFNRYTSTLNIYNENGKHIGSDKKSPKTKFFPSDSRHGLSFYEITPDEPFGTYADTPRNIIHVYSNDFFIFENLNFSYNNSFHQKVIYNGRNFLTYSYFDDFDKEIEANGKFKEFYNNSPFLIGEDGLYILVEKIETIRFKENSYYKLCKISNGKYSRDSVISTPDGDHGDLILKEQFKDYCLIRKIYWDINQFLALRTSDLQIKQQTYIVPGILLDFKIINGWEIYTTDKGEYTYAGKRGNKYEKYKSPFTHEYPFEYLFGGYNFFINNIAKYFNVGLLQFAIMMTFILGITFIFVYAFKQK